MAKPLIKLNKIFSSHPQSVGESYAIHARFAGVTGLRLVVAGLACVVHALLPFLFERTASTCINDLSTRISRRGNSPAS